MKSALKNPSGVRGLEMGYAGLPRLYRARLKYRLKFTCVPQRPATIIRDLDARWTWRPGVGGALSTSPLHITGYKVHTLCAWSNVERQ